MYRRTKVDHELMLDVTRYANKLKRHMEIKGWHPESPDFKHQRQPSRPETEYPLPPTPEATDTTGPVEILNPTPPTKEPQPDMQPQAPDETPRTPMEPKKIQSD